MNELEEFEDYELTYREQYAAQLIARWTLEWIEAGRPRREEQ